jgi:hypothetical protein
MLELVNKNKHSSGQSIRANWKLLNYCNRLDYFFVIRMYVTGYLRLQINRLSV